MRTKTATKTATETATEAPKDFSLAFEKLAQPSESTSTESDIQCTGPACYIAINESDLIFLSSI